MALLGYDLDEIARILAMMEDSGLDELLIEEEDRSLKLRGPRRPKPVVSMMATSSADNTAVLALPAAPQTPKKSGRQPGKPQTEPDADQVALTAGMVGVFYRSEKPGAPPLVGIGQHIAIGQIIGIIEAMKVFSEVPADHSGVVVAVPAQDGQLVQADSALVILQKE